MRSLILLLIVVFGAGTSGVGTSSGMVSRAGLPNSGTWNQQPQAPEKDEEIELLASWLHGDYNSHAQADRDAAGKDPLVFKHRKITMHLRPCPIEGLPGPTFYIEQHASEAPDQPYRQRIYQIFRKRGELTVRTYELIGGREAAKPYIMGYKNPEVLKSITAAKLTPVCDLVVHRKGKEFVGKTPMPCPNMFNGAVEVTSDVTIGPDYLFSLDRGWAADGQQAWGPNDGVAFEFRRVAE
ncbi:MAG TPA: chromophore lyase CpcT/CpeT [Acidobacteriota bacterium]|nr:chromophore lyase CpcT/CpeT [Acidobacteriota bacterium]HND19946.1 chromophore lyase CpcT/CpeT [Acidobacteriota bacterium]